MGFAPERTYWIANEWYWRITENTTTLTLEDALRDFAKPLVALADRTAQVRAEGNAIVIDFADQTTRIDVATHLSARVAISHLISDLNRMLAGAMREQSYALVIPRRYELCGVLLEPAELDPLWGDPVLFVPSSRGSGNR